MIPGAVINETPAIHFCRPAAWPEIVERQLAEMPKRWLLRNERVSVIFAGLSCADALVLGPWPQACLLLVTFGKLHVVIGESECCLWETDSMVLAPHVKYELYTPNGAADYLLMNLNPHHAWLRRCLCHGTAARKEMFGAAGELLGIHAHL